MPKYNFNKVCSPVNLLLIFRTAFLKNTSGSLLLTKGWCLFNGKLLLLLDFIKVTKEAIGFDPFYFQRT